MSRYNPLSDREKAKQLKQALTDMKILNVSSEVITNYENQLIEIEAVIQKDKDKAKTYSNRTKQGEGLSKEVGSVIPSNSVLCPVSDNQVSDEFAQSKPLPEANIN